MTAGGSARPYGPAGHYDRVTAAWTLLLGPELHYGVFVQDTDELASATARLTTLMAEASRLEPGLEVLDVGCGTGAPARRLAAEHAVRVTGITTSAVGVELARAATAAAGLDDLVAFALRDATDNGLEDESFDRVWVLESSHLMRRRDRLLAECARVLRPGGRLALCDVVLRREMPFAEVRRLRGPLMVLREVFGDARMEPLGRYVELATATGLVVDEQVDLTDATRPTFERWRDNAHRHRDEVVAQLGEADWRRFLEATDVVEHLWDGGQLGYGLVAASKPLRR